MKYLLLLICSISFAQNQNISVKYNTIYFTETIKNDSTYILRLSENPKIQINGNKGFFKNAECKCSGTSIFMRDEFNFEFQIKDYKVEIYNIRFQNSTQIEIYGVRSDSKETSFESLAIKDDKTLIQNGTFKKNYECLSQFFKSVFNL